MSEICNRLNLFGVISLLILVNSNATFAQSDTVYFNKIWVECDKANASFYRLYEVQDSIIKVDDYYLNDQLQASGYVRIRAGIIQKLKFVGDLEGAQLGEWSTYTKKGKLSHTINHTPFNEHYGVGQGKINLLDSMDTVDINLKNLTFSTSYFAFRTDYGFLLDADDCHGHWTRVISKNAKTVKRAHNYENELNGIKTEYYRSGMIKRESYYKDDVLHGEKKRYNRKGRLVEGKVYEEGTLMETWRYHKPKKQG